MPARVKGLARKGLLSNKCRPFTHICFSLRDRATTGSDCGDSIRRIGVAHSGQSSFVYIPSRRPTADAHYGADAVTIASMVQGDSGKARPWVAGVAVLVTLLLTGCSTSTSAGPTTTEPTSTSPPTSPAATQPKVGSGKPTWIVADWAIADMKKAGLSSSLMTYFFDNPQTYLIAHSGEAKLDAALPEATRVQRFTSFPTLQAAISQGTLLPGVTAVMYDNEAWSFTPPNEKANPVQYALQAESLAHQHHLKFVFTPAVNLAMLGPVANPSLDKYANYLAQNMAAGSRASDVFDIQSQQAEGTSQFATFVHQAVAQAKAANPRAILTAGIGPNPGGRAVTATQVLDALQSARADVSGFWLNLPAGTPQCPQCGTVQPQIAVQVLQSLAGSLGVQA